MRDVECSYQLHALLRSLSSGKFSLALATLDRESGDPRRLSVGCPIHQLLATSSKPQRLVTTPTTVLVLCPKRYRRIGLLARMLARQFKVDYFVVTL